MEILNDAACAAAIGRLGVIDRELALIATEKSEAVAAASKDAETRAAPLAEEKARLAALVGLWCTANRARLTEGYKTKTIAFPTGKVLWRRGRDRVVVDPAAPVDTLIARLKKLGLARFIRTKEELDISLIGAEAGKDPKVLRKTPELRLEKGEEKLVVEPIEAPLVAAR